MKVLAIEIYGFRGIASAKLSLSTQMAFIGPNGAGKSTIVDALSLVFGRQKLVRDLTEHDFYGSCPRPQDRIRIVATLGGFRGNNPQKHPHWFRHDRATEKWWNRKTNTAEPLPTAEATELCVQIGYAARFDHDELTVEQCRYFHDDDEIVDPFIEDSVSAFPYQLLYDVGYFVLPARRTWASTFSFASELFRRAVTTIGGIPASSLLKHRDELRSPSSRLEEDPAIQPLVTKINQQLAQLVLGVPMLQLRVTSTDCESLLQALVPHYKSDDSPSLPASRHGTGLISLQTFVLLVELGRARKDKEQSFILALEEPELHVPPGLQRRLIGDATAVADQVVCTTHSPRVAAFFEPQSIQILTKAEWQNEGGDVSKNLQGRALAADSLISEPNAVNQLYTDDRTRLVEALMFNRVLIPEGRIDFEWLRLFVDIIETGTRPPTRTLNSVPPFGSVIGVVPTRDAAVEVTFTRLRSLHTGVVALVDGDGPGDTYKAALLKCAPPPACIIQWANGWTIEDVLRWVIAKDEANLLNEIEKRLGRNFGTLDVLIAALKNPDGRTLGLKSHYVAHEEIASAIKRSGPGVRHVELLLEALTRAALGKHESFVHLRTEPASGSSVPVYRFCP